MGDLDVTADQTAAFGLLALWALFSLLGVRLFRLRPVAALTGGLLAAVLHFFSELWHQSGHALAAKRTGYRMSGVHIWGVLGTSVYPSDEPALPPEVHVERALGGPRASALLTTLWALLALATRSARGVVYMVATLETLENLLVFTLGAFMPLPFLETDGTVLRKYAVRHRRRMVIIQE
jgi:hypothetical protein